MYSVKLEIKSCMSALPLNAFLRDVTALNNKYFKLMLLV